MKTTILAAAAIAAAFPVAAQAQNADSLAGFYVGGSAAYHDIGEIGDDSIDGFVLGGYVGYNIAAGSNVVLGVEGNGGFGTGDIDGEYGVSAHVGYALSPGSMLFVRGGYQEVNFDLGEVADLPDDIDDEDLGFDDSDGDYLVGVGGEFGVGEMGAVRLTVDTISFDTLKVGAGYTLRF